ncbi:MAG: carbonic anhydrase [Dermabacter sp.]|nr:carbonic anhydrase [Dermabacter sp.]
MLPESAPVIDALRALEDGNARFVAGTPERPHQDAAYRASLAAGQHPFAVVFGCSDSRVSAELLFDQGFGDLFVIRTAGHVADDAVTASIEFAVDHLGVSALVVLGHEDCGAVGACVADIDGASPLPGRLPILIERIRPHLEAGAVGSTSDDHSAHVRAGVHAHVRCSVEDILRDSAIVRRAHAAGKLQVAGAVYSLASGEVTLTDH